MPQGKSLYIAIEGPIGVGKTTLCHLLAELFQSRITKEIVEENPFLPAFYQDPERYAFQTQLFFLLSRYKQQADILQDDLFARGVVSDYLLVKDRLFASLTLKDLELALYDRLWAVLSPRAPRPDLVILLLAPVDVLLERIARRGRSFERDISREYLMDLSRIYAEYFEKYTESPLLVIDTSEIDFVRDKAEQEHLLAVIREHHEGVHYFKPLGSS